MDAYVRDFVDPLEGLLWQLEELGGFARTVPPLIEADRQALWDHLASEPGDPDEELVDVYARESGKGTGGGFADFGRTCYVAALVIGWEVFSDYLGLHLAERERPPTMRRWGRRTLRDALEIETTGLPFPRLIKRYTSLGIQLAEQPGWDAIQEIRLTRNALVHNLGRYTREYFDRVHSPRYPTDEDFLSGDPAKMSEPEWQEGLVDQEDVPLDVDYVGSSLDVLATFARAVDAQ